MEIIKFKTSVKSEEEVTRVSSLLDKVENIHNWKIDTGTDENILSISGENLNPQQIENTLKKAGFEAEILRVLGIGGEGL